MSLIQGSLRSLMLIGSFSAISLLGQTPQPPIAPAIEHEETRFGTKMVDNYFWLRDKSNPEVDQVSGDGERLHRRDDRGAEAVRGRTL